MKKQTNYKDIVKSKGWLLIEISLISAFAGMFFQLMDEQRLNFMSIIVGCSVGFSFWVFEFFVLAKWKKKLASIPILINILIKAISYLFVIYLVINLLGLVIGYLQGLSLEEFFMALQDRKQLTLYAYTLALFVLLSFHIQINLLLGEGIFRKLLLGYYRRPTLEHRIFMFLDLKSSTTIAEKLGHTRYYSFLNDFFHEISDPVHATSAEIYQYVGDEVVLTWKTENGLRNNNCLSAFFRIKERIVLNKKYYLDKYGVVPEFKAGIHFGEVITAQIGDIKKEIVYNGDILNTSARIQEQCNRLNRELLVSGLLLKELKVKNHFVEEKMETLQLRGKENITNLYSIVKLA